MKKLLLFMLTIMISQQCLAIGYYEKFRESFKSFIIDYSNKKNSQIYEPVPAVHFMARMYLFIGNFCKDYRNSPQYAVSSKTYEQDMKSCFNVLTRRIERDQALAAQHKKILYAYIASVQKVQEKQFPFNYSDCPDVLPGDFD